MVNSVALVGFADTKEHAVHSTADELWSLNQAYRMGMPRLDRVFEIHPWSYLQSPAYANLFKEGNRSAVDYLDWLKGPKDIPVYMLEERPEVPGCVRFPIEYALLDIFGGQPKTTSPLFRWEEFLPQVTPKGRLLRGDDPAAYVTSSFNFMMMAAILEGVKRIEVYGFEMSFSTEYLYQKAGAEFIIGVAIGRGIDVVLTADSALMRAQLYGYEGAQMVSETVLAETLAGYQELRATLNDRAAREVAAWTEYSQSPDFEPLSEEAQERLTPTQTAAADANIADGAVQIVSLLLQAAKAGEQYISRQTLESYVRQYRQHKAKRLSLLNSLAAAWQHTCRQAGFDPETPEHQEQHQALLQTFADLYTFDGVLQGLEYLVALCDLQQPTLELVRRVELTNDVELSE